MRFTTLLGTKVVSSEGEDLGRIVDLRCTRGPENQPGEYALVGAIVFGRVGWLERLGFLAVREQIADWKDVALFGRAKIELSAHYRPRPLEHR